MADVKTLTVHGIPYSIKDETARNNITDIEGNISTINGNISNIEGKYNSINDKVTKAEGDITYLKSDVSELTTNISENTSGISKNTSDIDELTSTVNGINSTVTHLNQLNDKINSYFNDSAAVPWAGTSNRQLSMQSGYTCICHYTVIGRVVFFNIYASAIILEANEQAWINCPSMLADYPILDRSMGISIADQNAVTITESIIPSYAIIEDTFVKIKARNNMQCNWNKTSGSAPSTLRLSGFYISNKHND